MKKSLTITLLLISTINYSQTKVKDTVTRRANIKIIQTKNQVNLLSENPPLVPIAGAPKPSYTHFWEMGDGTYSKEVTPKHTYKKPGNYKVNLSVTNNYDNGKPPATRPKTVAVNDVEDKNYTEIASLTDQDGLNLFANREPVPDEEMVVVASYQNNLDYATSGKLYLFFNEVAFKNNNFELKEVRNHFGEKETTDKGFVATDDFNNSTEYIANQTENIDFNFSKTDENLDLTLTESKATFKEAKVFEFENMAAKETRNMFFSFKTTPEMINDTSATVKMRSVFVPDRNYKNHSKKTLEMEIVTSHDPNKMSSNATSMNYRTVRLKTINFKTRFQNDGEGPARTIRLETDTPDMFDKKTLEIVDLYPKCPICPKDKTVTYSCLDTIIKQKQIHFTFKNIYVPGSNQKNVKEKDSTKGFVKYTMKFVKDFHKQSTKSRTSIFFDKNEAVVTNSAKTDFKTGISIGVKAGFNHYADLENSKNYFVAATISPYKSYKYYGQIELQNSFHTYNQNDISDKIISNGAISRLYRTINQNQNKAINFEIPILMRYNINNYIGFGTGIQANINLTESTNSVGQLKIFEGTTDNTVVLSTTSSPTIETSSTFSNFKAGLLVDLTVGVARIGPSFGARYVMNFKKDFNYIQLYGIWKF